jgi:branched-subunit amino acid aminotransferase/4-amino-4-deoxychorismate lyase
VIGPYFIRNGELRPVEEAVTSIADVNLIYGFGVYETLKIRRRVLYFPERHEHRLYESARIIGLEHPFAEGEIVEAVRRLGAANRVEDANVKILLIGGSVTAAGADARLEIMLLAPLFPDRRLYKRGATAITVEAERHYPASKSLSMTVSTMAFRNAQRANAYDALLVNRHGQVTEGTRTNLYLIAEGSVVTPPTSQCLDGVTRETLIDVLREMAVPVIERPIRREELMRVGAADGGAGGAGTPRGGATDDTFGIFLSSTSTKVLPLRRIDATAVPIPGLFASIADRYNRYLRSYAETQAPLW